MSEVTITTYEGDTITAESVGTTVTVIEGGVGGPGPAGPQGDPGPVGPKGDAGTDGADGTPGATGPAGSAGADGAAGPQGPQGLKGDPGDVGPAGPAGADGPQGPAGADGATGPQGVKGDTGATGPTGPAGPGVPAGGTTGQVPTKASSADYDITWQAPSAGSSLPTGGSAGQILTKNSSTNADASWADPLPGMWFGWKAAVAAMSTKTVKVLHLGDSTTEGTGVTALSDVWSARLAHKIRAAYPGVASNAKDPIGYVPAYSTSSTRTSPWTITGAYDTASVFGLRRTACVTLSGAGATITGTVTGTAIDIWYTTGTASGAFTVSVDGGTATSIGGSSGTTTPGNIARVSLGASGSHTVTITRGSANCFIEGITVYDGNETSGYTPFNAGWHGTTTGGWANVTGASSWQTDITKLNPDVVTIMLDLNDYTSGVAPSTFATNLETLVNWIRDASANYPTMVLISTWMSSATSGGKVFEQYQHRMPQIARRLGCVYLDLRKLMPDVGTSAGSSSGYYADSTHLTAAGNEKVATELASLLLSNAA